MVTGKGLVDIVEERGCLDQTTVDRQTHL
jgi:hypothetical protein